MQPDLKTLEGQLDFLNYHAPDERTRAKHQAVNNAFQQLWQAIQAHVPDGPGKTVAIREINNARMACNSCIANEGT